MSRSLSRIRNLVSEIEEIRRNGQQGGTPVSKREALSVPAAPGTGDSAPPFLKESSEKDPFLELASIVDLNQDWVPEQGGEGKVSIHLSGAVTLSLQVEKTGETLEVKQIGNAIEIRFADGKAFHIPLKVVA